MPELGKLYPLLRHPTAGLMPRPLSYRGMRGQKRGGDGQRKGFWEGFRGAGALLFAVELRGLYLVYKLRARVHARLAVDVAHMRLDGARGDEQLLGHMLDATPLRNQDKHLGLALRQLVCLAKRAATLTPAPFPGFVGRAIPARLAAFVFQPHLGKARWRQTPALRWSRPEQPRRGAVRAGT